MQTLYWNLLTMCEGKVDVLIQVQVQSLLWVRRNPVWSQRILALPSYQYFITLKDWELLGMALWNTHTHTHTIYIYIYIYIYIWNGLGEQNSMLYGTVFHFVLILLRKAWIHLFLSSLSSMDKLLGSLGPSAFVRHSRRENLNSEWTWFH